MNMNTNKKASIARLVRINRGHLEDVDNLYAGDVGATFGVDCTPGTTFTSGSLNYLVVCRVFSICS